MNATGTTRVAAGSPATHRQLLAWSEVALGLVTLAAVFGLRRVFVGTEWLAPLAVQVVVAHAAAALLRRAGAHAVVSFVAMGALAAVVVSATYVGDTTTFGIPGPASIDAIGRALEAGWAAFPDVKAPTEPLAGFLIAAAVAVWASAAVGDWAAFRLGASFEAVAVSATTFVVTAVLSRDQFRGVSAGVWLAAVLLFLLLRRADRLGRAATWVGERRSSGPKALVTVGAVLAVLAIVGAAVVSPRLPGAQEEAIVSLRDLGDDDAGTRITVSPLVDIRSRLVDQADTELFTVRTETRAYWRLTSLDNFDGRIWKSNGSYGAVGRELPDGVDTASAAETFDQQYSISALSQIWLPAAFEPQAVAAGQTVRYDEVSATLIVDQETETSNNLDYQVRSSLPVHSPDELATASTGVPTDIADAYLGLPSDFSPRVSQVAEEVTAAGTNPYARALLLQDFFRDGFTYDLDVGPGHGENAIEDFVLETREGYCEQFAGSYAAMARSLGIPARVAVGFTPGVQSPTDTTLYRVTGKQAHAWPEVYLGDFGWVAFEPTPGRGAPFAERYTGVPESQVAPGSDDPNESAVQEPATTTPVAEGATTTLPDFGESFGFPEDVGTGDLGAAGDTDPSPWPARLATGAGVLVSLVAAYLLAVPAVTWLRRHLRRRRATTGRDRVALAWDESLSSIRRAGVAVRDSDTHAEVDGRVRDRLPEIAPQMAALAHAAQVVAYAPVRADGDGNDPDDDGADALGLADTIGRRLRSLLSPKDRLLTELHPRRLLEG